MLPRREDLSGDRGVLIVAYASHKKKAYSFFLLQVMMPSNLLQHWPAHVSSTAYRLQQTTTAHASSALLQHLLFWAMFIAARVI